jgi:hypothetical protein
MVIVIVKVNIDPQKESEFNRWYNEEHIPNLLKVPGVIKATRGVAIKGGGHKYITVYEHESEEVRESDAYKAAVETQWTRELRPFIKDFQVETYRALMLPLQDARDGEVIA